MKIEIELTLKNSRIFSMTLNPRPPHVPSGILPSCGKLLYLVQEPDIRLSHDVGTLHRLPQVLRDSKQMCIVEIFPPTKNYELVWIFLAAKKMTSFGAVGFAVDGFVIEYGLSFCSNLDIVPNKKFGHCQTSFL